MELSIENLQKLKSVNNIVISPITIYDMNGKALVFDGITSPKPIPYAFLLNLIKEESYLSSMGNSMKLF